MFDYLYNAIVFDFDGTLVESNEVKTWAFGKLYEGNGYDIVQQVRDYHKKNEGISRFIKFRYFQEKILCQHYTKKIEEQLSDAYSKLVFDEIVNVPYVDGAIEFLEKHYKQTPLFVASGTPETELRNIIKHRSMTQYFEGVYGSPTTKKDILKRISTEYGWPAENILMVGDSLADLEGAKEAGSAFIAIKRDNAPVFFSSSIISLENLITFEQFIT